MTFARTADLDQKFRRGDQLRVIERDGYGIVQISTDACTCEIALQGAQVLRWRPKGHADVLWCGPLPEAATGKAIRGGIPICWPWFGPHATAPALPQHGLVRTVEWELAQTAATAAGVQAVFTHTAATGPVQLLVEVGERLRLQLTTANFSSAPLTITEALHTYFAVADVGAISIHGLDGCIYRDNTDAGRSKMHSGPLRIARETIALFDVAPELCTIDDPGDDPGLSRRIQIRRAPGRSTVVWNPGAAATAISDLAAGAEKHFVCVESGNTGTSAVTIAPNRRHHLEVTYEVSRL